MLHIPILRKGEPYKSLDVARVAHHQTRELFVEISQANSGLIRRDLRDQKTGREKLAAFSTAELIEICAGAADHFLNDSLPLGDATQTPEDYVRQISATTGMPHVLARRNMAKIHGVLSEAANVINGLTRNIDWEILDSGFGEINGHSLSFYPRAQSLGVVLPNNSPGVHSLSSFEDPTGTQTRQRRALESLPDHSVVHSGRSAARSVQFLSRGPCRQWRDSQTV